MMLCSPAKPLKSWSPWSAWYGSTVLQQCSLCVNEEPVSFM